MSIDVKKIRQEFPALDQKVNGQPLIYMDSAATTLKPTQMVEALSEYYLYNSANVHRGAHYLSDKATGLFESSRETVRAFLNAPKIEDIVFTSGTTESINLVADILTKSVLDADSEVVITELEHHSNIVPWQIACVKTGAQLKVIPVDESGELNLKYLDETITEKTKIVSLSYVSNALGTVNPVDKIISRAREVGALVMLDAAQAVSVLDVDVQKMDCDFLAFSAHKLFGPNGIGVLYAKSKILNEMPPYKTGGSMIDKVTLEKTTFLPSPQRFEAGTPHVAGAIGMAKAIDFVQEIGLSNIYAHEKSMAQWATDELSKVSGLRWIGSSATKVNILSFVIEGTHPSDVGQILDQQGLAVRAGHHCCQPLMQVFDIPGTVRASVSIYNTPEEVEKLIKAINKAKELLL